jgi:hypothetical protein
VGQEYFIALKLKPYGVTLPLNSEGLNGEVAYSTSCEDFAQSIKPRQVLSKLLERQSFVELARCFGIFAQDYIAGSRKLDVNFVVYSKREVIRPIDVDGMFKEYCLKLSLYRRLAENRIDLVLNLFLPQLQVVQKEFNLSGTLQLRTRANALLCATASQIFFTIEPCCKIACSLGDLEFGRRVATDAINNHDDVFRTLKTLARGSYVFDFNALAKLYAYTIETRIVADYTDFFHGQYDAAQFLVQLMLPAAQHIFNSQSGLLFECAGV